MSPPLILEVIRPFRARAIFVLALVLVDTALTSLGVGMVLPVFQALLDSEHSSPVLGSLLPVLSEMDGRTRLAVISGATILLFLVKAVIAYAAFWASQEFVQRLRFYWVARIGEHYLYGPHLRVVEKNQGQLLNDWFNETYAGSRYLHAYLTFVSGSVLAVALVGLSLAVHWQGTLVMLACASLLVWSVRRRMFGGASDLSARKILAVQGVTSSMLENLTNIRDIKLMQAETRRLEHLSHECQQLKEILIRGAVNGDAPRIVGEFLAVFAIMAFVLFSALAGTAQPSEIVPVMAFMFVVFYRLFTAGSQLVSARVRALNDVQSVRLVHHLVTESVEYEDREHGAPIERIETDISFEDVEFSYDGSRPALRGVTALVPRGQLTFLLGPSGAGKSTLLDLLLRLTEPTAGRIKANGRSAAEFNLGQWRRRFGYVSQEVSLFNGSIRMNLLMASPDASDQDMIEACRLAGAEEFIRSLPSGFDTLVGDRGHALSGGQRKRIAIARALINRPDVLILDEATTSIEESLEEEILGSIRRAMPELTVIQVTHRPRDGIGADWVIGLEDGRLVASGTRADVNGRIALASTP